MTEYKRHVKHKTHTRYIANYLENMKETEEFVSLIKQQRVEIGLLQQKVALLQAKMVEPITNKWSDLLYELD